MNAKAFSSVCLNSRHTLNLSSLFHHPCQIVLPLLIIACSIGIPTLMLNGISEAEVTTPPPTAISPTDGTGSPASLGTIITPGTSTVPTPLCTASCVITGGTRAGDNLFHSFGNFNIGALDSARFQTALVDPLPDASVSNILARVTGGSSSFYGSLDSATYYPSANLFLMNPAGFLFGPNATVNVGGMMAFTTANYMPLTDVGRFNADPNAMPADLLTAAPVAAFGFIGSNPQAINFQGGQLTVAQGTGITLVGGDINLLPDLSDAPSGITAPGRSILLTSVAGSGEVAADTAVPALGMTLGTITLGQGTVLSTVGDSSLGDGNGGSVSIRGGQFVATGTQILTGPAMGSMGQGGAVTVAATDSLSFTNSFIDTSAFFAGGNAGAITVAGSQVSLQDTFLVARAESDSSTTGSGGDVTLTGTDSVSLTGSSIITDTFFSNGNGGAVTLMAPIVSLEEGFILTGVGGDGITPITASGGAVTLSGTTSVSLQRSTISTESFETEGNSGAVKITAPTVTIVGSPETQGIITGTHNSSGDPNAGNGGDIEIAGTNVTLTDFARLESVADSPGTFSQGGTIRITGSDHILLDNGTFLLTTSTSQGSAGNMELVGQHVTIRGQSALASETLGPGSSGTIQITGGENIAIESASRITTTSPFAVDNQGPAGTIEFNTQQLTVTGGSQVSSSTFHNGAGGSITVNATDQVIMTGGASITTSSNGSGIAGNIQINAGNHFTMTNSTVTTDADAASGGNIKITTSPEATVWLQDSTISASVADGPGGGGNISIDPQFVILQNSHILAQAAQGQGGTITIITNLFLQDATSTVNADSGSGFHGTVTIQSPNSPISGQIQPLGKTPLIATSLLNQRCASLAGGAFSSFTVAGRDSLPTEPDSWLASPLYAASMEPETRGERLSGSSGVFRASNQRNETNQINQMDQPVLSLRQIAPAGFLTQAFAVDRSASCQS